MAVLGTNGISATRGLTTPDQAEALVKAAMVTCARRVLVATDSSKAGDDHLHRFADARRGRRRRHRHRPRRRRRRRAARGRPRGGDGVIVTLTPNPSIDRAIVIDALRRGEVHRATSSRVDPGGKGVNVSRALAAQGTATLAVLPAGGPEGHLMDELLDAAGVARRSVPVAGALRMNISVLEPDGTTTKLNEPGPRLSPAEVAALLEATLDAADGRLGWVVGCGSLPPGAPTELYAALVTRVRERGIRVAVDSSGRPDARSRSPPARTSSSPTTRSSPSSSATRCPPSATCTPRRATSSPTASRSSR